MNQRSLWQVLATYAVASWAVYQVALGLRDGLGLMEQLPLYALLLMLAGLPLVIATWLVQRRLSLRPETQDAVHRHLTWRGTLTGGAVAFVALAIMTALLTAFTHRHTLFAEGVLAATDPVLLADFVSKPDTTLGSVVTEAIRVDMMQSRALRLAQPARIGAGLRRMNRSSRERFTNDLARELAEREGYKAIISGDVSKVAGAAYLLTARLVTPRDSVLMAFSETAKDSTAIIAAVNRLSKRMRAKIGESLKHVRASKPLYEATTTSLPALRKYSEAMRLDRETADGIRAAELFQQAVILDSTFASAWQKLGTYRIEGAGRRDALTKAYALRDRLPDIERYRIIASYMRSVEHDSRASMEANRQLLDVDSMDLDALTTLGSMLETEHRYADAEVLYRRAVLNEAATATEWSALWSVQYRQDRVDSARATLKAAVAALPDNAHLYSDRALLEFSQYRFDLADTIARAGLVTLRDNRTAQVAFIGIRFLVATAQGRMHDAEAFGKQNQAIIAGIAPGLAGPKALPRNQLVHMFHDAQVRLQLRGDTAGAIRDAEAALRKVPLASIDEHDRPLLDLAWFYSLANDPVHAGPMLAAGLKQLPDYVDRIALDAQYKLAKRDFAGALAGFSEIRRSGVCNNCYEDLHAHAFVAAGQPDSARAAFERYFNANETRFVEAYVMGPNMFELARLHDTAGDTANAAKRYSNFIDMWGKADADLQPRVQYARRRLAELRGKG